MTLPATVFCLIAIGVAALNAAAVFAAAFEAGRLRANGEVPRETPDFLLSLWDPFSTRFIEHVYTNAHALYRSRFITRCVYIVRVTAPLTVIFISAMFILMIAGKLR